MIITVFPGKPHINLWPFLITPSESLNSLKQAINQSIFIKSTHNHARLRPCRIACHLYGDFTSGNPVYFYKTPLKTNFLHGPRLVEPHEATPNGIAAGWISLRIMHRPCSIT